MLMLSCFAHMYQLSTKCSDDAGLGHAEIGLVHELHPSYVAVDLAMDEQGQIGHGNAADGGVLNAPQVRN